MHDLAISTGFHAELMLNSPSNLGSTIFWMFPSLIIGVNHLSMWIFINCFFYCLTDRWSTQIELSQS
jgi:hypothetical protein